MWIVNVRSLKFTFPTIAPMIGMTRSLTSAFNTAAKAWFPNGPEDPNMELVEVRISEAEYWNVKENKLLQMIKMGTAAATGSKPEMGEHKEVRFN